MANRSRSLSDLPEGMITEVLKRLPVKSLVQCKSVCKPWLSLISNPHFVKSHIHHAITNSRHDPTLLTIINARYLAFLAKKPLVYPGPSDFRQQLQQRRRQLINQALNDAHGQDLSGSPLQFCSVAKPGPFSIARFVTCCNGIICLAEPCVVYLWNPSIKMFKKLPFPIPYPRPVVGYFPVTIGFGYDSILNEYKLLRFVYENGNAVVPIVKVYYVNADFCKEIQAPVLRTQVQLRPSNVVVNGVLYFDAGDQLVTFDLHEEVFGLVPFPNSVRRKMSDVMDFQGFVAMVFESGPGLDLWTLDNISGQLGWTKKFSIDYGLADLDTNIWLSCYLGAKQFYGKKLLIGNFFVYGILYEYEKKETKYYRLREEYVNIYSTAQQSEIPINAVMECSVLPLHAAFKYTETLVAPHGFEPVMENASTQIL